MLLDESSKDVFSLAFWILKCADDFVINNNDVMHKFYGQFCYFFLFGRNLLERFDVAKGENF